MYSWATALRTAASAAGQSSFFTVLKLMWTTGKAPWYARYLPPSASHTRVPSNSGAVSGMEMSEPGSSKNALSIVMLRVLPKRRGRQKRVTA